MFLSFTALFFLMAEDAILWNLSDFYQSISDSKIATDMKEILKETEVFAETVKSTKFNKVSDEDLLKWLKTFEKITEKSAYLGIYSYLVYSTTSQDVEVKSFYSKVEEFESKVSEKMIFFPLALNTLSDKRIKEILKNPAFKPYHHFITYNNKKKKHQLTEKEEQIIFMKDLTGNSAFIKLYIEIISGAEFTLEIDGEMKKFTYASLGGLRYSTDPAIRRKVAETYQEFFKKNELVFSHIFYNCMKNWKLEIEKRKYQSVIQPRNMSNEINDQIVEALEKATTESTAIVERYYNLKKKILNLPELTIADIYAPIGTIDKKYTYEEGLELVKTADEYFTPQFKKIVEEIAKDEHIDATSRTGKDGGAYCSYGKIKKNPFVFTNYDGSLNSVLTLAHELGHAIHFYFIQREQNYINFNTSLPVAEIASVFNEIVVFDYLINTDLTKEEKLALLCNTLEGNFATSFRQNAFHRWESKIYEIMENRQPTTKDFTDTFVLVMKEMFGKSITQIDDIYSHFCFAISHFLHTPFYVYAYNMSYLLVVALYKYYLEIGKEQFVPKYIEILKAGGSLTPGEMLIKLDIDLSDPSFWKKGLKYLEEQVDKIEELVH